MKHGNKKQHTCKVESQHQPLSNNSFEVLNVLEIEGENIEVQSNKPLMNTPISKVPPNLKDEEDSDQGSPKKTYMVGKLVPSPLKDEEVGKKVKNKFSSSSSSYSCVLKNHRSSPLVTRNGKNHGRKNFGLEICLASQGSSDGSSSIIL